MGKETGKPGPDPQPSAKKSQLYLRCTAAQLKRWRKHISPDRMRKLLDQEVRRVT